MQIQNVTLKWVSRLIKSSFHFVHHVFGGVRTQWCSPWCWWALRGGEAVTPPSAAPFAALQGASFEPLALPSRWTGTENGPLHLAKWQPLTMRAILFDTGQTPKTFCSPVASCWLKTPVQLQSEANKVRTEREEGLDTDSVMERCRYRLWQAETRRQKHQVSLIVLINTTGSNCRLSVSHTCQ